MIKNCVITGATGYIGSKLSQQLLDYGWVVNVILRKSGTQLLPSLEGKVVQHTYDGSTESLISAIKLSKPDVVFHLASFFIADHRSCQITDLINSNILFATQLLEACAVNGIRNFVNTGTSWQHFRNDEYDPVCLYAATKQSFESLLDFYVDANNMNVITLKLFDTYGPDDTRPKLLNLLFNSIESGDELSMSPGDQLIDLVHIDDVIRAYFTAANHLLVGTLIRSHKRYAVSSGAPISLRQLVELLEDLACKKINVNFGGKPYRKREVMHPWKPSQTLPGWIAQISLANGLKIK